MFKAGNVRFFLWIAASLLSAFLLVGCSVITIPTPNDIIDKPLGTETIKIGMTKKQVELLWGKPDQISIVEDKERWPTPREVWLYTSKISLPINAGYLAKPQKLYFDGDNLTDISG